MLSGWGVLAAAGAVIFAAKVGRSTFNDWKRQKYEGRHIDLAEEVVRVAGLDAIPARHQARCDECTG